MASNFVNPTGREALNDHKVDALTTKNNNMKQRRVVNAAPAVNANDYIIKGQVDSVQANLTNQINGVSKAATKLQGLLLDMVDYGLHSRRLSLNTGKLPNGALYFETDRNNVEYQLQGNQWFYTGGVMTGTQSPDQRPTDLGTNDTGFLFQTTDTNQLYRWSGTAWVLETAVQQINSVQTAAASTGLSLTTSLQNIPGTTLSLTKVGTYLIIGVFDFTMAYNDVNNVLIGEVSFTSTPQAILSYQAGSATTTIRATVTQNWVYVVTTVPNIIYLAAMKNAGTGGSSVNVTHTTITAMWVST